MVIGEHFCTASYLLITNPPSLVQVFHLVYLVTWAIRHTFYHNILFFMQCRRQFQISNLALFHLLRGRLFRCFTLNWPDTFQEVGQLSNQPLILEGFLLVKLIHSHL